MVRIRGEASPLLPWPATADEEEAATAVAEADGRGGEEEGSDGGSEEEGDPEQARSLNTLAIHH